MLFSAVGAWALPGSPYGKCGTNVNWKFENGTLTISGTGPMDNSLAFSTNDWPWHEYSSGDDSEEDWLLFYFARVKKIIVEDGVTEIGNRAFRDFSRLESVTIADSVTSIKYNAFYNCPKLRSISLGNGVKTIENNVFQGCSSLTEITLPGTVESIGDNVFQGCSSLKTVTFKKPASQHNLEIKTNFNDSAAVVRYDGECSLFYGNNRVIQETPMRFFSAKTLVLTPYNTQLVSEGICGSNMSWEIKKDYILAIKIYDLSTFGMKEGDIDESIYNYKNETEVPWHIYRNDLKGVTIEERITRICNYAFSDCKNITDIVIPNTVKEIGTSAFKNCVALKDIVIPSSLDKIGESAFQNCAALKTVTFIVPPSVAGKINFGKNAFDNTTAVIRYDGEGVLKNESIGKCVTAGSTLSDFGIYSRNSFAWLPNSSISFLVKADDFVIYTTSGTEISTTAKIVNKFGLIRDVKWSVDNTHVLLFDKGVSTFSGDYKVEITESNDNEAKIKFFVEESNKRIYLYTNVTASCGDFSRDRLIGIMFEPPKNASSQSASVATASEIEIQKENAILSGKTGDTLTASYSANSSELIWTLMPDSGILEHAKSFDINSSGDIAEIEAVFDRKGEYHALVFAKNSSGDIVDADALTFSVTDDEIFTLAPERLYFNATVSEPKDASVRIKSTTNTDGVKWGVFWDKEPTNSAITSNDSGINITAEWDNPGEYHALVTADSEECFDYAILTFSVAKTNIFELLLDKVFFSGSIGTEFDDASILISGDVEPSEDLEWTLNFDGKVISEEELNFLYNDAGTSVSPAFSTEGEHQIQIAASKGDCTRSVTFTFIAESETIPTEQMSLATRSSGGGCNTGLGFVALAFLMAFIFLLHVVGISSIPVIQQKEL